MKKLLSTAAAATSLQLAFFLGRQLRPNPSPAPAPALNPVEEKPAMSPIDNFTTLAADFQNGDSTRPGVARRLSESGAATTPEQAADFLKAWAEEDPQGAWRWFLAGGGKQLRGMGLTNGARVIFSAWGRQDIQTALRLLPQADPDDAQKAAGALLDLLNAQPTVAATIRDAVARNLDQLVLTHQGKFSLEPGGAAAHAEFLVSLPPGESRDLLLLHTAADWRKLDWQAAAHFAQGQPEPLRSQMTRLLVKGALEKAKGEEPASAAETAWVAQWFTKEASTEMKTQLGPPFARSLALTNPSAALAWARKNLAARPLREARNPPTRPS